MDKRDKRHQREKQRETQNKQSKEFRLFDKETKDYSYSLIFTNDLKEIFDAKSDCKALFEKDQDNDYFYCFDKTGKYVKCISQENNFNGTWNEFKSYSMIQWSNSECVVIYLKDYTETTIESILDVYLMENESLCLENDLMESNMEIKVIKEIETIKVIKEIDSKQKRFLKLLDLINSKEFKSKKWSEYYLEYNSNFEFKYKIYDTWYCKWIVDNSIRRNGAVQLGYKKGVIGFYESNNNESCLIENDRILKFYSEDSINYILNGLLELLNVIGFFN